MLQCEADWKTPRYFGGDIPEIGFKKSQFQVRNYTTL